MDVQAGTDERHQLLVGSYTAGQSQGIYRMHSDSRTGQLDANPLQVIKTENPSWLTLSKDMTRLFVVNVKNGPGQKDPVGKVSSYVIDPKTHALSLINQVQSLGNEPTHSSLSGDGRHLLVSNYSVVEDPGGTLAVLPVGADGKLASVVQLEESPSRARSTLSGRCRPMCTPAASSPDGKHVPANDLGADKVFIYRYDPKANPELPLTAADPAFVQLPPGSGPRHLLFSADGKHAWLTMEMSAQVAVFDYRGWPLDPASTGRPGGWQAPQPGRAAGCAACSADGKFLYVSNRGTTNEVLVFAIDLAAGTLKELQRRSGRRRSSTGVQPRPEREIPADCQPEEQPDRGDRARSEDRPAG